MFRALSSKLTRVFDGGKQKSVVQPQERLIKFQCAIDRDQLDINEIRELAFSGIPDEACVRHRYWEVLLGLLPTDTSKWKAVTEKAYDRYEKYVKEFFTPHAAVGANASIFLTTEMIQKAKAMEKLDTDDPLGCPAVRWGVLVGDAALLAQIRKDVTRTRPAMEFFQTVGVMSQDNMNNNSISMTKMLFVYGKLNPGISYVQGMNEIIAVLFYVIKKGQPDLEQCKAEAECFFCFTSLMADIMDNFIVSSDQSTFGIKNTLKQIEEMICVNDQLLGNALRLKGIDLQFFCFRWVTLLFTQEFEMPEVIQLWDSILSQEKRRKFIAGLCCSFILNVKSFILSKTFAEIIELLQHYPVVDLRKIIKATLTIKNTYKDANDAASSIPIERPIFKRSSLTVSESAPSISIRNTDANFWDDDDGDGQMSTKPKSEKTHSPAPGTLVNELVDIGQTDVLA